MWIQETRRRLRRVMADDFSAAVEQATGRRVRSYISDIDLAERVSVEVFLLGAALERHRAGLRRLARLQDLADLKAAVKPQSSTDLVLRPPASTVKVQSAGQTLRPLANRRWAMGARP